MRPDAYLLDWYGYATNQAGHFMLIGMALYGLLSVLLGWSRGAIYLVAGYAVWEISNVMDGGLWWDSLEDTAYVLFGMGFLYAAWFGIRRVMSATLLGVVVAILIGVLVRFARYEK